MNEDNGNEAIPLGDKPWRGGYNWLIQIPSKPVRLINPIDSSHIFDSDKYTSYRSMQEDYALLLWALQEKYGLTYDEAVLYGYG